MAISTGFVGTALVTRLALDGIEVRACVRRDNTSARDDVHTVQVGDLAACADWSGALVDVSVVVHAAARVHVMDDTAINPLAEFRRVNVDGTLNLARQAAASGIRRFIFISSIKVNGESTPLGHPFTAEDTPAPADPYGISKHEAELGLRQVATKPAWK